jgi:hypothetical protein
VHLFGGQMKNPEMNLPQGEGEIDYYAFAHAAPTDESSPQNQGLKEVRAITCELFRKAAARTWGELDRAFHSTSNSMNNGK